MTLPDRGGADFRPMFGWLAKQHYLAATLVVAI
jgi:hypothetical protein